jgi:hypothetical protein
MATKAPKKTRVKVSKKHITKDTNLQDKITFFSDEDPNKVFIITKQLAKESTLLTSMLSTNSNFEFHVLNYEHFENKYSINNVKLLNVVYKYLINWSDSIESIDYITNQQIQTNDLYQILKKIDIDLINDYINEEIKNLDIDEEKYNNENLYNLDIKCKLLSRLLTQVDEYLDIQSFSKKIYAYLAVLIWNTNIIDYHQATKVDSFKKLQNNVNIEWNHI